MELLGMKAIEFSQVKVPLNPEMVEMLVKPQHAYFTQKKTMEVTVYSLQYDTSGKPSGFSVCMIEDSALNLPAFNLGKEIKNKWLHRDIFKVFSGDPDYIDFTDSLDNDFEDDEAWNSPERLIPRIKSDLTKVKLVNSQQHIDAVYIQRIANAYPVYSIGYRQRLLAAQRFLAQYSNLTLAGRLGLFWYNNMDGCILSSFDIVDRLS